MKRIAWLVLGWLALIFINAHAANEAISTQVSAGDSMRVDGVLIYGKVHDVSVADIHEVLAGTSDKYASLEVVGKNEIHAHLQSSDLGWIPMRHSVVHEPDLHQSLKWMPDGRVIWGIPEAMSLIRTADEVYVFPVITPLKPHPDDRHLRLLDADARLALVRLLGNEQNWLHGFNNLIGPPIEPTNIGFLFRKGSTELTLFFTSIDVVQGTFNGENTGGSLDFPPGRDRMESWKEQYAKPELAAK